jgi:hypothetical protein
MSPEITIRPATIHDIDFVSSCIIEADRAGKPFTSYENIFNISDREFRNVLKNILEEEIEGCELFCDSYFLASDGQKPIAGVGAWMEGTGMQASNVIRANLFSYCLGAERWQKAQHNLKLIAQHDIPRLPGALQFEDAYVVPEYRGYRVIEKIFAFGIREYLKKYPSLKLVQGFSLAENIHSIVTLTKMKWKQKKKIMFDDEELKKFLPRKGKILWELDLADPKILADYLP